MHAHMHVTIPTSSLDTCIVIIQLYIVYLSSDVPISDSSSSKCRGQLHLLLHHSQPTTYLVPNLSIEYELQALLHLAATNAGTCCTKY